MTTRQCFATDLPGSCARFGYCYIRPMPAAKASGFTSILRVTLPVVAPAAIGLVDNGP